MTALERIARASGSAKVEGCAESLDTIVRAGLIHLGYGSKLAAPLLSEAARAALTAIRKPTDAMKQAMVSLMEPDEWDLGGERGITVYGAEALWQEAIDAALQEGQ